MPDWQPNWTDVRWDWGAADQAAQQLRQMANRLRENASLHQDYASQAQIEWLGRYREEFDNWLSLKLSQVEEFAGRCSRLASEIDTNSDEARREQARREWDRGRWWDEYREENDNN